MVTSRTASRWIGGLLAMSLVQSGGALAFPFLDPTNQDTAPTGAPLGTELPAADVKGLRNQLRLTNPGAAGNPSAWTILPRLTIQEMLTDNALEVSSPRSFDALTVIAPGITVLADTARLQLSLDYQPTLIMHAVNGPLNALTQQLTAFGLITVVPDLAYVDVRALSGVQSRLGALAGAGTLGAGVPQGTGGPAGGYEAGQGLNRNNLVQTSSIGISPYLLKQFGDYGSGKLGASVNAARYSSIDGFASSPLPFGGKNGQSLLTTEQIAHYQTGEFLRRFQYSLDIDLSQSETRSDPVTATAGGTTVTVPSATQTSQRRTINNQVNFALNRNFTFFVSSGYQEIKYSTGNFPAVNGLIWQVGATVTPDPDSSFTVMYGRQNGADSFQANGHFAIGGRSLLTFDYSNTVGTQLENLQNQLNNSQVGQNGAVISAITGGPTLQASNGLGVQNGVFRFNTFNTAFSTQWLRDTLQVSLNWSEQTSLTPTLTNSSFFFDPQTGAVTIIPTSVAGPSSDIKTATIYWAHDLSPDLLLSSSASYSYIRRSGGVNDSSLSTSVGLQYTMSASTTVTARYSFFDRISKIPGYSLYENIVLLGITKQF